MDDAVKMLKSKGLKATPQRIAILNVFSKGRHLTLEQVFNEVRKAEPSISISTVYNTLNLFTKVGILRSFEANGKTWYELAKEPHINIICSDTGEIIDIDADLAGIVEELRSRGIEVSDINVIVHGNCGKMKYTVLEKTSNSKYL